MSLKTLPMRRIEETIVRDDQKLWEPEPSDGSTGMEPPFGRCPVCQKALRPRDKVTGEPKAPPVGTGHESRAICTGCGAIICYIGNGEWRPVRDSDWKWENEDNEPEV